MWNASQAGHIPPHTLRAYTTKRSLHSVPRQATSVSGEAKAGVPAKRGCRPPGAS